MSLPETDYKVPPRASHWELFTLVPQDALTLTPLLTLHLFGSVTHSLKC
jgi:hypothetical protein